MRAFALLALVLLAPAGSAGPEAHGGYGAAVEANGSVTVYRTWCDFYSPEPPGGYADCWRRETIARTPPTSPDVGEKGRWIGDVSPDPWYPAGGPTYWDYDAYTVEREGRGVTVVYYGTCTGWGQPYTNLPDPSKDDCRGREEVLSLP